MQHLPRRAESCMIRIRRNSSQFVFTLVYIDSMGTVETAPRKKTDRVRSLFSHSTLIVSLPLSLPLSLSLSLRTLLRGRQDIPGLHNSSSTRKCRQHPHFFNNLSPAPLAPMASSLARQRCMHSRILRRQTRAIPLLKKAKIIARVYILHKHHYRQYFRELVPV